MKRPTRQHTAAFGLLAAAGIIAFALVPQPRVAIAQQQGASTKPAQPAQMPAGHPPIENQLPAGHPPIPTDGLPPGHPPIPADGLPPGHPPTGAQLPAGHPTLADKGGAPTMPPPAEPADVGSIDTIVSAYYDSISAPSGAPRNWDRFRSLFIPEGRLIAAEPRGALPAAVFSPDQFVRLNAVYFEKGGYVEHDIFRRIETYGNTAHIFSTYETRRAIEDAEPYSRGINSIQLVNDGARWWIVSVMWDFERPDNPIPAQYLPTASTQQTGP
jgi:hypothetical protein